VSTRIITLVASLLISSIALANDDPFPRLGGVQNGGSHNYGDAAYQADLAKLRVVIVGAWPGWGSGSKTTLEQAVRGIKKINPNTLVFQYVNSMEVSATDASVAPYFAKVDAMKWWLNVPGSTDKILSEYGVQTGKSVFQINNTLFTAKDSDGYQEWEWQAHWVVDQYYIKAPSLDGFFEDNVFYQPRIAGDWNRDGVKDTPAAASKWLQEGYRARFALLHKLMPGKFIIGNIADIGKKDAEISTLKGALDGGLIEGLLGSNYSQEKFTGWADMMRQYRKTMDAIAEPKLVLFHNVGTATDYQSLRYGLASCLLDDAYFAFTDTAQGYGSVAWFDEFDVKLGKAISPPALTAWQKGVYRRDFEGGVALVNPKGNGAQDVTIENGFSHLSGKQAPSINDGKPVSTIHLLDRDGVILLRVARPISPKAVVR
jgi:hypothetical protein